MMPNCEVCLVNGCAQNFMSVKDRGLAYGDGVFRTLRIQEGKVLRLAEQIKILLHDAKHLLMNVPSEHLLIEEATHCAKAIEFGVLKIILTRAQGLRGYSLHSAPETTRIMLSSTSPMLNALWLSGGIELRVCDLRLSIQPRLAQIKHLNRLENVLARSEWQDSHIVEGLLLDLNECLIGGTMSNLWLLNRAAQTLTTPCLQSAGILGLTHRFMSRNAHLFDLKFESSKLSIADLMASDCVFISNSLLGFVPVKKVQQQEFNLDAQWTQRFNQTFWDGSL